MNMIGLVITICTILIIITIFAAGYVIECHIKDLKKVTTRKEIVDYINNMDVYIRDKQGNILKHHAHIGAFNMYDCQKIIIDINKNE